ncbi:hypothetical protein JTE90_027606 [Oedothorax gibbosus]|uniref:Uncharacterized protein n=1 Tax=Oedothorax gibbosus TaxID=931172 RepID=A0AAV6VLK0_9ARAC|nr:hypothetical protein JTE90_027606 [Oedothorax gibbosus]
MDCNSWDCDHHCAQVCKQYLCPCDYKPGYTPIPSNQRVCCKWELVSNVRPKTSFSACNPIWDGDVLTRYFGVARSIRDPHDRFTGVNHVPSFLHTDTSRLDFDFGPIIREREWAAHHRPTRPGNYYKFRSIRPRREGL